MSARLAEQCRKNPLELVGNEKIAADNNSQPPSKCQRDAFIGLFFDGTNNNKYRDLPKRAAKDEEAAKTNSSSNVARLFAALGELSINSIRITSPLPHFSQPYQCQSQSK